MNLHRLLPTLPLILLSALPFAAHAQSASRPFDPASVSAHVEIGPVAGLTTAWHSAPKVTGVPLGTTVRLRVRVPPGVDALWTGAREIENRQGRSVAELRLDTPGERIVVVRISSVDPETVTEETLRFEAVDLTSGLQVGRARLAAEPLEIDSGNPNASTMALYFQGSSIAALTELSPGAYRTSNNRWITISADVFPASVAPLLEWRLDDKVLPQLGTPLRLQLFTTGSHTLAAGLGEAASLETYRVRLTSPRRGEPIRIGVPVTFTATTDPPGLESEITWLASTKYGRCEPGLGTGPEFTTTFSDTVGETGTWLGVRADDAALGLDGKGDDCADLQRAAAAVLPALGGDEEFPSEAAALRALRQRTRQLTEESASGAVCAEERFGEVLAEYQGQTAGCIAALELARYPGFPEPFLDSCISECAADLGIGIELEPYKGLLTAVFCCPTCAIQYFRSQPDLVVEPAPGSFQFCADQKFTARIRNAGLAPAAATTVRFRFNDSDVGVVEVATGGIPAGGFLDIGPVTPPPGCFSSDCFVEICADPSGLVEESDETNNCVPGTCIG